MAILKPDKTLNWNGVTIKEYLLTKHNPNKIDMPWAAMPEKPLGVTVHNTSWINVSSSTTPAEQYTRATVNGNMGTVRVHFYVDNKCAWQNLPLSLAGWHAADGDGDGNRKTISIECIMKNSTETNSLKSEDNCAKLVAYLLKKYDLNVEDNLFTHTHWLNVRDGKKGDNDTLNTMKNSYKNCPAYILPHWDNFKKKVQKELDKLNGKTEEKKVLYRVRKTWEDSKSQLGAYSTLEAAKKACLEGYSVFDEDGKCLYTNKKTETSKVTEIAEKTETTKKTETTPVKIDVTYRVYTGGKWLSEVKNLADYAGIENTAIRGLTAKVSKGNLKYRVHTKNGGWLSWIEKSDIKDWNKGCAGLRTRDIDAVQFDFFGVSGYTVKYRVSTTGSKQYLDWVVGYNNTNDNGYAGILGKTIDKIQVEIIKK